jgi:hypothetical protein
VCIVINDLQGVVYLKYPRMKYLSFHRLLMLLYLRVLGQGDSPRKEDPIFVRRW